MKYTGTYSKRRQAQRQAAFKQLIRTANSITSAIQMKHVDSGKANRYEELRDTISSWTMCHDDLEELEDMTKLIVYVATRKARQAQRARKFAQTA